LTGMLPASFTEVPELPAAAFRPTAGK